MPAAGFPLTTLPGRGIPRKVSLASIAAAFGVARGVLSGIGLVRRLRPQVVVVLGGYAAVPCTIGAILWRVPMVVMEQNARAGAANRLAGRFARAAAVPFDDTDLPRAVLTGNPVRPEILAVDRAADRPRRPGRSSACPTTGSCWPCSAAPSARGGSTRRSRGWPERWADRTDLAIHHVVGARDWDDRSDDGRRPTARRPTGSGYQRVRYEDRMPLLLSAADLAICRAGGSTVAELAVVGLGAVLVPLPIATRDHQTANAAPLVRAGAAVRGPRRRARRRPARGRADTRCCREPGRLEAMARAARTLAFPDAAERVADLVEEHARRA